MFRSAPSRIRRSMVAALTAAVAFTALPAATPVAAAPLSSVRLEADSSLPVVQVDHRRHRRHSNGDAVAAGIIGLAAGAIIGGALASPPRSGPVYVDRDYDSRVYYYNRRPSRFDDNVQVYRHPRQVYRNYDYDDDVVIYAPRRVERPRIYAAPVAGRPEPWSAAWYSYCESRYRSFDPRSGTFLGYDGQRHFCN